MFSRLIPFNEYLTRHNRVDEIYDALDTDDLSDVALTAMGILKTTYSLPFINVTLKSEKVSEDRRNIGNNAYQQNSFQHALMFYNQAILYAPKSSKAYKLAVSNRSALLQKLKAYKASLTDVQTCFTLGCPTEIVGKLKKRKEEVCALIDAERITYEVFNKCVDMFFNCNITSNPHVPYVSADVEFKGSVLHKIVAAKEIKIGTVIACEKAYVSYSEVKNGIFACHYCHKRPLNLTPCDNCCYAMFCDEECKKQCNEEFHKDECKIIDVIRGFVQTPMQNLMLRAALKMKSKCQSWSELIDESYNFGLERMKTSSIQDIYDTNKLYSVLNIRDDKPFVFGLLYNNSFVCGALLHYFGEIPSFYPTKTDEKLEAMKAMGRIMMFLSIYLTANLTFQVLRNLRNEEFFVHPLGNYGVFPFIGKLKNSCKPNTFVVNRNNELILISMRTIKAGEELTISNQRHWLENEFVRHHRHLDSFVYMGDVCECSICSGAEPLKGKGQLSSAQKKYFTSLNLHAIDADLIPINKSYVYLKLLEALDVLSDVPHSEEYEEIYNRFRRCILFYENIKGGNFILDRII